MGREAEKCSRKEYIRGNSPRSFGEEFLADEEKERAAGPKKNFGEGASIKIFRSPAGQGGAEAFQISEKIPAAGGGGLWREP